MSLLLNLSLALLIAQSAPNAPTGSTRPEADRALALQVALDRAGFSPGVIDGQMGGNTQRALGAYRKAHGQEPPLDVEPVTMYTIAAGDVNAEFAPEIPPDLVQQAALPSLTYTSPIELLAERYHASPALLKRINPEATFAAGEQIRVPNVEPFMVPAPEPAARSERAETGTSGRAAGRAASTKSTTSQDVVVTVSKGTSDLTVRGADEKIIFHAPVTTGSEHDPLPIGEWKVKGVQYNPEFHYNPDLFWDADPSHSKARLSPGPNNPVGVVWIDLSKEHYGIHGTPEPATVGKTASHGCVRLTNWDALKLARLVKPGTRVVFTE